MLVRLSSQYCFLASKIEVIKITKTREHGHFHLSEPRTQWKMFVAAICMLRKCANPGCSTSFRYFGSGRLFVLQKQLDVEYFWLCSECLRSDTLDLKGIDIPPRAIPLRDLARPKKTDVFQVDNLMGNES